MENVCVCVYVAGAALQAAVSTHFPPLASVSGGQTETNNPRFNYLDSSQANDRSAFI